MTTLLLYLLISAGSLLEILVVEGELRLSEVSLSISDTTAELLEGLKFLMNIGLAGT